MKAFLRNYWVFIAIALTVAIVLVTQESALAGGKSIWDGGGNELFEKGKTGINQGFTQTRGIVYGVGGLGAIGLGALAFFGRFQWAWFFALIGGLSLIALVDVGITTLTGQNVGNAQ